MKHYSVKIAGVTRKLPLLEVAPGIKVAFFNILGDTEIVEHATKALAKKISMQVDLLVTPEVRSIPLAYELSKILKVPYIVVRKTKKPYMLGAIKSQIKSLTTDKPQIMWLSGENKRKVKGKKVILVDDVVSSGGTFQGLEELMRAASATVVAKAAVFTEGDKKKWKNIISLGHLPIFKSNKT